MNKNQRIAILLKNVIASFTAIVEVLEEKESVPSAITILRERMPSQVKPLSDSAGRGTWGQSLADSNKGLSDGDRRTAAINELAAKGVALRKEALEKGELTPANPSEVTSLITSKLLVLVHSNKETCYYKRIKGTHRGTILRQDRKSGAITDGKYLVTVPLSEQLCMVSKDQDGIDYLNNYVRPSIVIRVQSWNSKKGVKRMIRSTLVRYYRPNNITTPGGRTLKRTDKKMCAVYLSDRYWTTKDGMKF